MEEMKKTAESILKSARENNEPVFILRAKDQASIKAIDAYKAECVRLECDKSHLKGISDISFDFVLWRSDNREQVKIPD